MPALACPGLVAALRGRAFTPARPVDACCPLSHAFLLPARDVLSKAMNSEMKRANTEGGVRTTWQESGWEQAQRPRLRGARRGTPASWADRSAQHVTDAQTLRL